MKNSQRNAKSITEVGRTPRRGSRDSEPMLVIKGYNQYVPDGIYLLSVECEGEYADDWEVVTSYSYFVLSGNGKHYSSFPQAFEQTLSAFW